MKALLLALIGLSACAGRAVDSTQSEPVQQESAQQIFAAHCSACHSGINAAAVSFTIPAADQYKAQVVNVVFNATPDDHIRVSRLLTEDEMSTIATWATD